MIFDKKRVTSRFDRAAVDYAVHAVLQRLVVERLLERLSLIRTEPETIIDCGSGTGFATRHLTKTYRKAQIIQVDLSSEMLKQARSLAPKFFSRQHFVCSDAENLPLVNVAELCFSSLMLQWSNDLDKAFASIKGALKKQALFIFSTLGPDTLKELRASWATVDQDIHVNTFIDMHDIGDALIRAGFVEPVIEVEHINMTYQSSSDLMQELKILGANNANTERNKGLTGKHKMKKMLSAYEQFRKDGRLPATYEIIYAHAWASSDDKAQVTNKGQNKEIFFPVSSLNITKKR